MLISETKLRLHAKKRLAVLLEAADSEPEGRKAIPMTAAAELVHLVQELTGRKILLKEKEKDND